MTRHEKGDLLIQVTA